ncbi:L,D-transpeptidase [Salinibacterium sp. SYSU T00001]|uniref:L,D-transpeptidase n=1 Tax=Homoserinimonas sedimenticola TaxID=2986805 RepID=UPI00223691C4|nr:L,D-transpeptidase [Salinibacterium sedimenticola]MCW4384529.1 L,D-transpeptidase [Salinibacterium sedimenticola]
MPRSLSRGACAVLVATALTLAGCAAEPSDHEVEVSAEADAPIGAAESPSAEPAPFEADKYYAAEAVVPAVSVHASPGGAVTHTFSHPQESGAPLNFLVKGHEGDWLEVYVPSRPNGASGWIMTRAVNVFEMPFRLEVSVGRNVMELYEEGKLARQFQVATGTGGTPTPLGTFFLTELMAPTNAGYGPYAYGLSAYSEVLNDFGGGSGQIGVHGTDDAASIGTAASHGCIRLSNADITELAGILPLGTPIIIGE